MASQCVESNKFTGRADCIRFLRTSEELQYRYLERLYILGALVTMLAISIKTSCALN